MKLLVGLGNIGKKYEKTRHNAGFLALDFIHDAYDFDAWQEDSKLKGLLSKGSIGKEKTILFKPTTLMNNSGQAFVQVSHYYKIDLSAALVLHDDLDIAAGTIRHTLSSRAAGHNGVQDLIDTLGTQDFARVRIGIGKPTDVLGYCEPHHNYVLENFTPSEEQALQTLFKETFEEPHFLEKFLP